MVSKKITTLLLVVVITMTLWFLGSIFAGDPYEILVRFVVVYIIIKELRPFEEELS
ncbi:hypothetical protein AJ85_05665 [Alkalihalobacillus alcalophilus ATCC 27647 = CGMCC 1.3604]|uniref:Uncharacterized protein n=1 Tax=Alkalihalobacillus alcalophilus ATCC 27647 = CGMCC 1.3604 TaxID=1218173 RepID=A0A4S4K275_ALKAL|nr:hypothetical protein BH791_gp33 [Bacillus phage BalMu-1]AJA42411.1 hypothetical protein BalMu1_B33 [Bacillus phage BalMu-1]AJA42467.1 hypothetical protein BalMu1_A33 [Bacillus phage BalMu-1]THG91310.1 hypothetical protein AJ85_05665 [Alkalihalobacillus alcalophilus ATCC 27647 = CGMCC 1.3604]